MRCSRCGTSTPDLTPCQGEKQCGPCVDAYLHVAIDNMIVDIYGGAYRGKRGDDLPITPLAARYRGVR